MTVSSAGTRPARVEVDMSMFSKPQCDLVRMALLLSYGHQRLFLAPDGSSIAVELVSGLRPVDIQTLVASTAASLVDE